MMDKYDEYLIYLNKEEELKHTYIDIDNLQTAVKGPVLFNFSLEKYSDLNDPLQEVIISDGSIDGSTYDSQAAELGNYLFNAIFPGELADFFHKNLRKSISNGKQGLRIRLSIDNSKFANVNWEYTHDENVNGGSRHLSTYLQTLFTRFDGNEDELLNILKDTDKREKKFTARTLFVTANPTGGTNLDPELEIKTIIDDLKKSDKSSLQHDMDPLVMHRSSWKKVFDRLDNDEPFDIGRLSNLLVRELILLTLGPQGTIFTTNLS